MKKLLVCITFVAVMIVSASCSNKKQDTINRLQVLTAQLDTNASTYSEEDWDKVATEFESIAEDIEANKDKFTPEERVQIDRLRAKCIGLFVGKAMSKAAEAMGAAAQQFGGLMEGFLSGLGNAGEKSVSDAFGKTFEALGQSLEKSLSAVDGNFKNVEGDFEKMGESLERMGESMGKSFESIAKSMESIGESIEKKTKK